MALKWLRDNLKHLKFILWGVVAIFVLLVFVDWGTGRSGRGGGAAVAVTIGAREVSEGEFIEEMRRMNDRFQQQFGDQWNDLRGQVDLAGQTVAYFVEREMHLAEAAKAGLVVSDEELQEAILANPMFKDRDGRFVGQENYERMIRGYFQLSPQEFERRYAEDLLISKLSTLVERGVYVTDAEIDGELRQQRETADLAAIQVRYERFLNDVTVADDELRAHYEAHGEDYRRGEQRVIRYLVVETSRLRRTLPVDTTELEAYYNEHRSEFMAGEQAHARHILFRLPPSATADQRAEIKLKADGVLRIAQAGGDFAELAKKHSEDPGSRDSGGDLGWFARGEMVPEFEGAVFNAKPGDLVGPVESQYGFHIIKVEGFTPERQQPFEEVEEQVKARVLEGRAAAEAEIRASNLLRRLTSEEAAGDEVWQQIADEDESVVLNVSPPFGPDEPVPGTGGGADLSADVFAADIGAIGGPRSIPRGWMVWKLTEVRPAGVPSFDEVRPAVDQQVRKLKALDLAAGVAAQIAGRWRAGGDPDEIAAAHGTSVVQAVDHRRGAAIGVIGPAPAVDAAAFAAGVGAVVGPIRVGDRGVVVAKVEKLTVVDSASLERDRAGARERLAAERGQLLLRAMINERRKDTPVTVNNELVERFAPRG
jgi:peptidyl-prolyl cis-trans isomerase D